MLSGKLKDGIRISKEEITFMFELPEVKKKIDGDVLGIDVGIKNVLSCSNGYTSGADIHGHTAETIMKKIARRKRGSVGFRKACTHRTNHINHVVSLLNVDSYKQINIEDIKDLRKGKRNNRFMSSWTYTEVFDKLESYCESHGVLVNKVDPVYTSQRCSVCGWTQKSNRNGKKFKCKSCGHKHDADLNASLNIALDLPVIDWKSRLENNNITGFYWHSLSREHIVPDVAKLTPDVVVKD
jgi:IS605 OrfB family transposase